MKRKASAVWEGGLRDGKGRLTTASGVLSDTQYSFATRFENGVGTIAAAHAGCFSMALSGDAAAFAAAANQAKAGCPVSRVLNATITLDARLEA